MARVTRRVLQMSDRELEAVIAVAMPGRRLEGMRRDELQEICMKWLFANGLSINHQFTIDYEGDEIYVLMSNKSSCTCCQKEADVVSVKQFDNSAIGTSLAIFNKLEKEGVVELQLPIRRNSQSETNIQQQQPKVHSRSKSDDNILSSDSKTVKRHQVQPIVVQPKKQDFMAKKVEPQKKEEPEKEVSCWKAFYRECGTCCFSLWSSC
ncbi:hypothetical protein V3C99_002111 [Haemonchus contortus]